jgi:hypothetical protein
MVLPFSLLGDPPRRLPYSSPCKRSGDALLPHRLCKRHRRVCFDDISLNMLDLAQLTCQAVIKWR